MLYEKKNIIMNLHLLQDEKLHFTFAQQKNYKNYFLPYNFDSIILIAKETEKYIM